MISLLYDSDFHDDCEPMERLDDFMLGKIMAEITPNIRLQKAAREVLERPLSDPAQVEYRREIVRDFAARRLPIERMSTLFRGFGDIQSGYRNEKSRLFRLFGGRTDCSELLKTAAEAVRDLISLINDIYDIFRDRTPKSKGLNVIKLRIAELSESQDLRQLYNISKQFCGFSAAENVTETELNIDQNGKIRGLGIISTQKFQREQKRIFGRKSEPGGIRAALFQDETALMISASAKELCEAFEFVISSVCGEFLQVYYDIGFYAFAVKYCDALKKTDAPAVYADLGCDTDICELYDLYLLLTLPNPEAVVPNDFNLADEVNGIIITGENSSGKTVYLRAVTMALIFTSAGLPIPAKAAKISLPQEILLQMASAERSYHDGDITGRFEEEVKDIKQIVEKSAPGTLALLNEVFQTTDYSEGAEGLYYILRHLNGKGAKWVLVTHLRRLEEMFGDDADILKMSTDGGEKYKVNYCG